MTRWILVGSAALALTLGATAIAPEPAEAVDPLRAAHCQARIDNYLDNDHSTITPEEFARRVAWMEEQCDRNNLADQISEGQGALAPEVFPPDELDRHGIPLGCMRLDDTNWGKHDNDPAEDPLLDPDFPGGMPPLDIPGDFMVVVIDGVAHLMMRHILWAVEDTEGNVVNPVLVKQEVWYEDQEIVTHASVWLDEAFVPTSVWVEVKDEVDLGFGSSRSLLPGRTTVPRTWYAKSGCHGKRGPIVIPQILLNHAKSLGWLQGGATTTESHYLTMEHDGDPADPASWYVSDTPVETPSDIRWTLGHPWFYGSEGESNQPAALSITEPGAGAIAKGRTTFAVEAADAEDPIGSLHVEMRVVPRGSWTDASWNAVRSRYEMAWDTTAASDGSYRLEARVTDSDGNTTDAEPVAFRIGNLGPEAQLVTPPAGAVVAGSVAIQAEASDATDPAGSLTVDVSTDSGVTWLPARWNPALGRYERAWNTTGSVAGATTVAIRVADRDGNHTTRRVDVVNGGRWAYRKVALASEPEALWRLGETKGSTARDATRSGHGGRYKGDPTRGVAGLVGGRNRAVHLDGAGDWIRIPDADDLNLRKRLNSYSVELWFEADDAGRRQVLYEQGGASRGLSIYVEDGKVRAGAWNLTAKNPRAIWGPVFTSAPIRSGERHHVVLVFDRRSDRLSLYVDGGLADSARDIGKLRAHRGNIGIGAIAGSTRVVAGATPQGQRAFFSGTVDEVAVYSAVLDPVTIRSHHLVGAQR